MPRPDAELCVVVPVYGCGPCLRALHARLTATLSGLADRHAIVFVDDRSPDGAWSTLQDIARRDPAVSALRLSRNFGQHAAITAGLERSTARWTIVMDCDLQDAPEDIGRLYAKAREGYDVVLARRRGRRHNAARRLAGRAYYGMINRLTGSAFGGDHGTFSILSRRVVDSFLQMGERERLYLFLLHWLGFERAEIDVRQHARAEGRSAYTLRSLVRQGLSGLFFQTTVLLRWIVYLGFTLATAGVVLACLLVYQWWVEDPYPGWTSLAVMQLVIGGFIIASTGVAGLYIGRIFTQVKGRPLYVVAEETPSQGNTRAVNDTVPAPVSLTAS